MTMRLIAFMLLLSFSTGGAQAADAQRGALVAQARCATCHYLDRTTRLIGPGLLGVFNRAPSISGVPFARWDAAALNRWLSGPRQVKPNTKMMIPPIRLRDRQDVIAWLAQQTAKHAGAS